MIKFGECQIGFLREIMGLSEEAVREMKDVVGEIKGLEFADCWWNKPYIRMDVYLSGGIDGR